MLQALLQTIANLGFDAQAVNNSFNNVMNAINTGDTSSLGGIMGIFQGMISAVTGVNANDVSLIAASVLNSVMEMLSNAGNSGVLSTITGA